MYEERIKTKDNKDYDTSVTKRLLLHTGSRFAVGEHLSIMELHIVFDSLMSNQTLEDKVKKDKSKEISSTEK
jgi:hypothetical protein